MKELVALFHAANTCLGLSLLLPDCDVAVEIRKILTTHCEICISMLDGEDFGESNLERFFADLDQMEETIESIKSSK